MRSPYVVTKLGGPGRRTGPWLWRKHRRYRHPQLPIIPHSAALDHGEVHDAGHFMASDPPS